jgi:peroxiredoxin
MRRISWVTALTIAGWISTVSAAERIDPNPVEIPDSSPHQSFAIGSESGAAFRVGDRAPEFSYLDTRGRWGAFRELAARGPVLLLFGATEADLRELERARPVFADLGMDPIVVLDRRSGSVERFLGRVGYRGRAIVDPSGAIGSLYGCLDTATRRHEPAWFLLDVRGVVLGFERDGHLPAAPELVGFSARRLRKPLPASAATLIQRISMASP